MTWCARVSVFGLRGRRDRNLARSWRGRQDWRWHRSVPQTRRPPRANRLPTQSALGSRDARLPPIPSVGPTGDSPSFGLPARGAVAEPAALPVDGHDARGAVAVRRGGAGGGPAGGVGGRPQPLAHRDRLGAGGAGDRADRGRGAAAATVAAALVRIAGSAAVLLRGRQPD